MLFQPVSIDSSTHRALTKHIAKSWEGKSSKGGRSIIMTATTEAPELEKQKREKQWEERVGGGLAWRAAHRYAWLVLLLILIYQVVVGSG